MILKVNKKILKLPLNNTLYIEIYNTNLTNEINLEKIPKNKKKKKSIILEINNNLFSNFNDFLSNNTTINFKISCLNKKSTLYQDENIQIGVISDIFLNKNKILAKLILYYTNKTNKTITNFDELYIGNSCK